MHEIFNMLLAVFDRAALMLICLFFLIRIRLFRELLHKSAHSPKELLAVTAIFSLFALFSTWSGVPVEGSLVNVRIIAVMSGGILFGPWVGIITGVIAGIHRYLIDIGGVTAIPWPIPMEAVSTMDMVLGENRIPSCSPGSSMPVIEPKPKR